MQLHLTILLPLITSVLAFPTTTTANNSTTTPDTNPLEKRFNYGWIGSFADRGCKGDPIGDRPKIHEGDCVKFSLNPKGHAVGAFFGTGFYHFNMLAMYTDDNCQNLMREPERYLRPGENIRGCTTRNREVRSVKWDSSISG